MDELFEAADPGVEWDSGSGSGGGSGGSPTSSAMERAVIGTVPESWDTPRNTHEENGDEGGDSGVEVQESKSAMQSFGERLGVSDLPPPPAETNARREGSSESGSKRSLDDFADDPPELSSRSRRQRLNNDFISTMGRDKSPVRKEREEHYRYAELSGQEINVMKLDVLYKISVLNDAGFDSPKTFTIDDSLVALEAEHGRLTNLEDLQYGMMMMRYVLTNGVSLVESVNENFRVSPLKLKGWSVTVHRDVNKYNPILLELYQQHAYAVRLSPLTKLCIALCFSAASTHLANSMRGGDSGGGDNNMFASVMNMFGSGAAAKRTPVQAPGMPKAKPAAKDSDGSDQPTMQGPPVI